MLKKIILILFLLMGLQVIAADNYLNSVVISKNDNKTSIVLRADELTKVKKEVVSSDKLILTVKNITQSPAINTLYKNTAEVASLIIQNDGNSELKIYIEAPSISNADIVVETPNSTPIKVIDSADRSRMIWATLSVLLLLVLILRAKRAKPEVPDINEIIKEREKALYQSFQREVSSLPSMNYKLKSFRKHVLKGETLRSYEHRYSKV